MKYVISDIHGCYREYCKLLKKISFSEQDQLYVLGDLVDRGPQPMKVILDLMARPNVVFIQGNHDYRMRVLLEQLCGSTPKENLRRLKHPQQVLSGAELSAFHFWMEDGGRTTLAKFRRLPAGQQEQVLAFLHRALPCVPVTVGQTCFVLTHAGIDHYQEGKPLADYQETDFLFRRTDYTRPLFADPNRVLVTGHTPTPIIRPDRRPLIYRGNGHIAVDCGCAFGGQLAALCLEDGSAEYVE